MSYVKISKNVLEHNETLLNGYNLSVQLYRQVLTIQMVKQPEFSSLTTQLHTVNYIPLQQYQ